MIKGSVHEITGLWMGHWDGGEVRIVEGQVKFTRTDGIRTPWIPFASTARMEGSLIKDYRVFQDLSPFFT